MESDPEGTTLKVRSSTRVVAPSGDLRDTPWSSMRGVDGEGSRSRSCIRSAAVAAPLLAVASPSPDSRAAVGLA